MDNRWSVNVGSACASLPIFSVVLAAPLPLSGVVAPHPPPLLFLRCIAMYKQQLGKEYKDTEK